jgi:hypothetical protein
MTMPDTSLAAGFYLVEGLLRSYTGAGRIASFAATTNETA